MDPGVTWPSNASDTGTTLGDPFGHRQFAGRPSGVDFHRGIDTLDGLTPQITYSPVMGKIIRKNYSMFNWVRNEQYNQSTAVNTGIATYALTGSPQVLRITGVNAGTVAFPANIGRFETNQLFNVGNGTTEDWFIQYKFDTLPVGLSGQPCFGIYQSQNNEYAAMWYDGTNFVCKGRDAGGVFGVDGTTGAPAGRTWMRIKYVSSSGSVVFMMSTSGTSWTTIATEAAVSWTNRFIPFKAFLGFNPAAAGANDTIDNANFEWFDSDGIGRFGNWVTVATQTGRWLAMHSDHILVNAGDLVYPGQQLMYTGNTGFDDTSGRILQDHLHTEYIHDNDWTYNNDEPLNPLGKDPTGRALLPRCSTLNISVTRTEENDPAGNPSHKLAIVVQRDPCQRFDINTFTLTGNSATRTLNWNTRSGLNPADNDANNYDGIYFEPLAFNEASTQYQVNYYWRKSVVGNTFVSASISDTAGNVLWSE